ncbi:MAG TPA: hypothetical protein VMY77_05065 [Chitinophagaceae bacterium]|nr:hypothetical protein [Chitinophagaceae bacterium]
MKKFIYIGLVICISLNACTKDGPSNTDPCSGIASKFTADIQPIINTSCATNSSCHAAGSVNPGGPLTDYNLVFAKRSNIKFQIENGLMPKTGSLTADQKNKIICWINSGAPQ